MVTAAAVRVPVMGTGATIRTSRQDPPPAVVDAIRARWEELEDRFSLYRPASEVSRIARGEVALTKAGVEVRDAYAEALQWRAATDGDFTPHRPDGVVDLSGIVKAYALRDAGALLDGTGLDGWLVEIGGDVLARSAEQDGWTAGIADPHQRGELISAVPLGGAWTAIATSGTAERGEHVWRSTQFGDLVQVTVLGRDIVETDVLATAILAGGLPALDAATRRFDVDVLTVARDRSLCVTPRLRRVISARL
jgi:thiamine biosynthesis lipoprotein